MLKYLAMFAVIFGLAVFVARQDERTSQEGAQEAADHDKSATSTKADEQHPQENVPNSKGDTPNVAESLVDLRREGTPGHSLPLRDTGDPMIQEAW
jgi:hypothetical protein